MQTLVQMLAQALVHYLHAIRARRGASLNASVATCIGARLGTNHWCEHYRMGARLVASVAECIGARFRASITASMGASIGAAAPLAGRAVPGSALARADTAISRQAGAQPWLGANPGCCQRRRGMRAERGGKQDTKPSWQQHDGGPRGGGSRR